MEKITLNQFIFSQPNSPIEKPTDKGYLILANRLLTIWQSSKIMNDLPDALKQNVVLGIVGYYQDIIADSGVWRTFISQSLAMYGHRVPFYCEDDDYIEYELNLIDVKFLVWYFLAFNSMKYRYLYPLEENIQKLGELLYDELERCYDNAPNPSDYNDILDVELNNPEYTNAIYDLSQWLFWRNYLLVPPFQLTYSAVYSRIEEIRLSGVGEEEALAECEELKNEVMKSIPTGPLALFLNEWLHLIVEGKLPKEKPTEQQIHHFYTDFTAYTGGKTIIFIKTYDELNKFFIDALHWNSQEEHFVNLKQHSDFVLMVTPYKGMMIAKDIAKCIKHQDNALYDQQYASENAFSLLAERGVCPADMLLYLIENNCLPDATFPNSDDTDAVKNNADFIARCYLQEYYRAD